jgi:hypothetical protein
VNLSEIRLWTHLNDQYQHLEVNQTLEQYENALRDNAQFVENEAPGAVGLEAIYYGWCGHFNPGSV